MKRAATLALGTALCAILALPSALLAADPKAPAAKSGAPAAKAAPAKAGAYKAPRNAFGQPNLEGDWSNASLTPETRPANLADRAVYTPEEVARLEGAVVKEVETGNQRVDPNAPPPTKGGDAPPPGTRPEFAAAGGNVGGYDRGWLDPGSTVMRVGGQPRTSILTTPNGRPPARKAGAVTPAAPPAPARVPPPAGQRAGANDNPEQRSLSDRCILSFGRNGGPPMLANGFYNNNYHIVQSRDAVIIETEMVHDSRIIRLNGKHRTDGIRPYFGDSIGHFEGETLVVETTNIPQIQTYNGSWLNLTVTEKFTRVSPNRILYQYTIHDPTLWDVDWGGEYEFSPLNGRVEEYACHEGNYALEGILAGERAAEAAAARTSAATPAATAR